MSGEVPESYADYADETDEPRFTDWLRVQTEPTWSEAVSHQFTQRVRDGTLDDDAFRRYLVQDYAFVNTLVGAFGHAVGDAPTMAAKSRLVDFLGVLTDEEDDYFERAFDALDVSDADRTGPALTPVTRAFEDLLERATRQGGYAETLAVLVPAEWVYLSWATPDPETDPDQFYLAEWRQLHAVPAFEDFVTWLRAELDREGVAVSRRRQARLERLFRRTVELEVAFFDAALDPETCVAGGEPTW